jgi:hypothetical protein
MEKEPDRLACLIRTEACLMKGMGQLGRCRRNPQRHHYGESSTLPEAVLKQRPSRTP